MPKAQESPTKPRKAPQQERSKATVEAILEAAAQVLVELRYARMTTAKVAARAGVSVGSLYQYFPSKDALIGALLARKFARIEPVMREMIARSEGQPMEARVRTIITATIADKAENPALNTALAEQMPKIDGIDYKAAMSEAAVASIRGVLEQHSGEIAVDDLDLAAFMTVHAVEGVIGAALLSSPVALDDPRLIDGLVRMVMGYLRPAGR
ncbi:MAG: TetR/AcrR family transcriptional regulator [Alphaproteobacteria bacterium]